MFEVDASVDGSKGEPRRSSGPEWDLARNNDSCSSGRDRDGNSPATFESTADTRSTIVTGGSSRVMDSCTRSVPLRIEGRLDTFSPARVPRPIRTDGPG